ncbi:(d)CMP kinase [Saxibacter everestensis]|uniref:Cytidylate kinase n=1 Tax=Saxibacter everestensis TaxID=2909229 RepID=A0ABY8QY48_9MICO|nr:(d)CMP kinase [Brevibacteriaceae bacterium ZFBP1038]
MTIIAVDGPSGSGKSSVSREVSRRLGLAYLDTGAMYRAVSWICLERQADGADAVAELARTADLRISTDPDHEQVVIDGHDVTTEIRETRISESVTIVSTNLAAREALIARQRALIEAAAETGIVAEGRDITTVVAPDADVRLLLTAREEARLARRAKELHGEADEHNIASTRAQIIDRDAADSAVTQFITASDGVHTLDSSALSFEETVQAVLDLVADAG